MQIFWEVLAGKKESSQGQRAQESSDETEATAQIASNKRAKPNRREQMASSCLQIVDISINRLYQAMAADGAASPQADSVACLVMLKITGELDPRTIQESIKPLLDLQEQIAELGLSCILYSGLFCRIYLKAFAPEADDDGCWLRESYVDKLRSFADELITRAHRPCL